VRYILSVQRYAFSTVALHLQANAAGENRSSAARPIPQRTAHLPNAISGTSHSPLALDNGGCIHYCSAVVECDRQSATEVLSSAVTETHHAE
jgi:hypothetical protein